MHPHTFVLFFFFSSRRRHTRLTCDWSSDVCSSDLAWRAWAPAGAGPDVPRKGAEGAGRVKCRPRSRSEERRVGEEGRDRGAADDLKKKKRDGENGEEVEMERRRVAWCGGEYGRA